MTVLSGPKEQVEGLSAELASAGIKHLKSRYLDEKGVYSVYKGSKDIQRILKMKEIDVIHANFIVNLGNANASDVVFLIRLAQQKVKEKFNIILEPELVLMGQF